MEGGGQVEEREGEPVAGAAADTTEATANSVGAGAAGARSRRGWGKRLSTITTAAEAIVEIIATTESLDTPPMLGREPLDQRDRGLRARSRTPERVAVATGHGREGGSSWGRRDSLESPPKIRRQVGHRHAGRDDEDEGYEDADQLDDCPMGDYQAEVAVGGTARAEAMTKEEAAAAAAALYVAGSDDNGDDLSISPTEVATPGDEWGMPARRPQEGVITYKVARSDCRGGGPHVSGAHQLPQPVSATPEGAEAGEEGAEATATAAVSKPSEGTGRYSEEVHQAIQGVEARVSTEMKRVQDRLQTSLTNSLSRIEKVQEVQSRNIDLLAEALRHEAAGRRDDTAALSRQMRHLSITMMKSRESGSSNAPGLDPGTKSTSSASAASEAPGKETAERKKKFCLAKQQRQTQQRPTRMEVDLSEDAEAEGGHDEGAGVTWTPEKLPSNKTGRWKPSAPVTKQTQKAEGWSSRPAAQAQISQIRTQEAAAAESYQDDAWEAAARKLGIFADRKSGMRHPAGAPVSFGPNSDGQNRGSSSTKAVSPMCKHSESRPVAHEAAGVSARPATQAKGRGRGGMLSHGHYSGKGPPPLSPNMIPVGPEGGGQD